MKLFNKTPINKTQTLLSISLAALLMAGCANNANQADTSASVSITEQSTDLEKVGYSYGYLMADANKEMIDDLDIDTFHAGFSDAYADKESPLTQEQMETIIQEYETKKIAELQEKAMAERQQMAEENQAEGAAYLEQNAAKEGVTTTDSGLQYKVLEKGEGASPTDDDVVKVHYEGKLIDGTIFDSSYERDEPAVFAVAQVVPGFAEGLKLMSEGDKYEFYIPAELAYGEAGSQNIEPNSMLIFTVELIEVNPEDTQPQ